MELKEAIGTRRTHRFLLPHRPVELEKIQKMLEAARLSSFWGNVQALRAVVVRRETATDEVMDSMFAPIAGFQIKQAPVVIVWYLDDAAIDDQPARLHELVDARALGIDRQEAHAFLDRAILPFFEAARPHIKQSGLTELDCGQGIAHAILVAVDEGLGAALLGSAKGEELRQNLGLPDTAKVLLLMCVGYPAESREAGGQRPRLPFEELYHLDRFGNAFPRDDAVVEELRRARMLQSPAPLPWRQAELDYLQRALDVPDF